jgi:hypothetical protein
MLSETVGGMDAAHEPTWTYSRRVSESIFPAHRAAFNRDTSRTQFAVAKVSSTAEASHSTYSECSDIPLSANV